MKLVSDSNHSVSRNDNGWFVKVPRKGYEYALKREHSANRVLGRNSWLSASGTLYTENLGEPVSDILGFVSHVPVGEYVENAKAKIVEYNNVENKPDLALDEDEMVKHLMFKMGKLDEVVKWSHRIFDSYIPDSGSLHKGLVHTDLHLANWVKNADGEWVLIDWEMPVWGSLDVSQGCLLSAFIFADFVPDSVVEEYASGLSEKAICWARMKSAASVGWAERRFGLKGARERMRLVDNSPISMKDFV